MRPSELQIRARILTIWDIDVFLEGVYEVLQGVRGLGDWVAWPSYNETIGGVTWLLG